MFLYVEAKQSQLEAEVDKRRVTCFRGLRPYNNTLCRVRECLQRTNQVARTRRRDRDVTVASASAVALLGWICAICGIFLTPFIIFTTGLLSLLIFIVSGLVAATAASATTIASDIIETQFLLKTLNNLQSHFRNYQTTRAHFECSIIKYCRADNRRKRFELLVKILFQDFDNNIDNGARYTRSEVRKMLLECGFERKFRDVLLPNVKRESPKFDKVGYEILEKFAFGGRVENFWFLCSVVLKTVFDVKCLISNLKLLFFVKNVEKSSNILEDFISNQMEVELSKDAKEFQNVLRHHFGIKDCIFDKNLE